MEIFKANIYTETKIELTSSEQLDKLFNIILNDEDFILQWIDNDVLESEVIISNNISSKVKNGDLLLTSKESN